MVFTVSASQKVGEEDLGQWGPASLILPVFNRPQLVYLSTSLKHEVPYSSQPSKVTKPHKML